MSRHTCGTQSAVASSASACSIGSHGVSAAWVSGAPELPTSRAGPGIRQLRHRAPPDAQNLGGFVDEYLEPLELAVGRGDVVDQLQLPVRFEQPGVRPDAVHIDAVELLGGGDEHVGHRAGGQIDHQIVDRIARGPLDHVEGQDVGAHRAERDGQCAEAAWPVL